MESLNIAIIGSRGVGKSSFVQRVLGLSRPPISNSSSLRMVIDNRNYGVTLLELDLEHFDMAPDQPIQWPKQINGHILPRVDGALILYDVTNRETTVDLPRTLGTCVVSLYLPLASLLLPPLLFFFLLWRGVSFPPRLSRVNALPSSVCSIHYVLQLQLQRYNVLVTPCIMLGLQFPSMLLPLHPTLNAPSRPPLILPIYRAANPCRHLPWFPPLTIAPQCNSRFDKLGSALDSRGVQVRCGRQREADRRRGHGQSGPVQGLCGQLQHILQ